MGQGPSGPMDRLLEPGELSMDEMMDQGPSGALEGLTDPPAGIAEDKGPLESSAFEEPQTSSQAAVSLLPQIGSTTLTQLPKARQPKPSTVCEQCPASMWQVTPLGLRCYCRIMHAFSWTTAEPVELTHCDGIAIASENA